VESVGDFEIGDAVEIIDEKSKIFAKGIVRQDSESVKSSAGLKTSQLPEGISHEVIHTDDLVILP
jgi:glutamate 5-kinase